MEIKMPKNVFTYAMNLGELETEVLRKLWIDFTEDTDGWAPDTAFYGRLTRTRVRKKLNQALMEMATFGQVIRSWFIIPTKASYRDYPIPQNVFDIIPPVYFFTSSSAYEPLDVLNEEQLEDVSSGWMTDGTTTSPRYAYKGNWNRTGRFIGITPPPTSDATAITLNAAVLERSQPYGPTEAVYDYCSIDSTATKAVSSLGKNYTELGVIVGLTIYNITDGSTGVITSISTTNTTNDSINVTSLTGGSTNQFNPADEFRILSGTYGGIIEIGDIEASYLIAPNPGSIPQPLITMAAGNMLVKCLLYPVLLVEKYQYPELPPFAHQAVASRAAGYLAREFPPDSPEFGMGSTYIEESNQALAVLRGNMAEQYQFNQVMRVQSERK
jgi:hypothetical protein